MFELRIIDKLKFDFLTMYLSCHNSLSLLNEVTLGTLTISVLASSLVTLEPWYETMITTPGTFGPSQRILSWVHLCNKWSVIVRLSCISEVLSETGRVAISAILFKWTSSVAYCGGSQHQVASWDDILTQFSLDGYIRDTYYWAPIGWYLPPVCSSAPMLLPIMSQMNSWVNTISIMFHWPHSDPLNKYQFHHYQLTLSYNT